MYRLKAHAVLLYPSSPRYCRCARCKVGKETPNSVPDQNIEIEDPGGVPEQQLQGVTQEVEVTLFARVCPIMRVYRLVRGGGEGYMGVTLPTNIVCPTCWGFRSTEACLLIGLPLTSLL